MNKEIIFKIINFDDKEIRLTKTQWFHIILHHPEVKGQTQKLISTIKNPDMVFYDKTEENYNYYRKFKETPVTERCYM